jgi:hypothetical protein
MKKLLYKLVFFVLISLTVVSIIFYLTLSIINKNAKFLFDENVEYIILGHSHTECAFNDLLIGRSKNIAQSAEPYFYSFIKIKKILSQNKNIKTVFVEFSNNQIEKKMDAWIWDEKYMSEKLPIYIPFMNKMEISDISKKNHFIFRSNLSKSFRVNLTKTIFLRFNYTNIIGGYLKLERQMPNVDNINFNKKYKEDIENIKRNQISSFNLKYLQKIINYCRQKKINIYLVRSPHHKFYPYLKNENEFLKIKNLEFSSIEFLDFNTFPIEDREFADVAHLNYRGASKFSSFFNLLLEQGLLDKQDKQKFINSKIPEFINNYSFEKK